MVSNAALRSREMTVVDLPESEERRLLSKCEKWMFRWNGGGDMRYARIQPHITSVTM